VRFSTFRLSPGPAFGLALFLYFSAAANVSAAAEITGQSAAVAQRYLNEKLALWQKRLNLEGWRVTVVTSQRDGLRAGTLGNIHWDPDNKTAVIKVLDPAAYPAPLASALRDMEFTVVHELVHLEFSASTRPDKTSRADEEIAVDNIAQALLQLDHRD
jgi:hypothetical protein